MSEQLNELNRTIDTFPEDSESFVDDIVATGDGNSLEETQNTEPPVSSNNDTIEVDGATTEGSVTAQYLNLIGASTLDSTHVTQLIQLARIEQDQEHERRLKKLEYEHLERLRELDHMLRIKEMEHEKLMRQLEEDARISNLEHQRLIAELDSAGGDDSVFGFSPPS